MDDDIYVKYVGNYCILISNLFILNFKNIIVKN